MLRALSLGTQSVDVLDLKVSLVSHGTNLPEDVYRVLAEQYRVQDPGDLVACNGLLLPGEVAAHVWQNDESPFSIALDERHQPYLAHQGQPVTPITFPRATRYYDQWTPGGVRYGTVAVLEGQGTLAFHYMWPCAYARTGEHCQFCFQVLADVSGIELPTPTPRDVGEIVAWALEDGAVKELQLTAGSRLNPASECERYASILRSIDEVAGLERLEAVAARYGPNKACSAFVVGLEPVETLLAGAEYLAQRGIVPLLSVWFPGQTRASMTSRLRASTTTAPCAGALLRCSSATASSHRGCRAGRTSRWTPTCTAFGTTCWRARPRERAHPRTRRRARPGRPAADFSG